MVSWSRSSSQRRGTHAVRRITIYEGHGQGRKDEIARRMTDTITDVCTLPREAVWVVCNEVAPPDWYVAGTPGKK
jgi:phenylpyruvate tautomerase PptA (4-oxalocrotonate tautomerase family)